MDLYYYSVLPEAVITMESLYSLVVVDLIYLKFIETTLNVYQKIRIVRTFHFCCLQVIIFAVSCNTYLPNILTLYTIYCRSRKRSKSPVKRRSPETRKKSRSKSLSPPRLEREDSSVNVDEPERNGSESRCVVFSMGVECEAGMFR